MSRSPARRRGWLGDGGAGTTCQNDDECSFGLKCCYPSASPVARTSARSRCPTASVRCIPDLRSSSGGASDGRGSFADFRPLQPGREAAGQPRAPDVSQANEYIYIEDQYFRAPMLNDAIVARMNSNPKVKLVVITKPINEWTDPGCAWTYKSHALFETKFPGRYVLLQLRSFDTVVAWGIDETEARWADIDVHSKMLIVDDKFLSVGSANKNNRGMLYEGEMNVAVLDPTWVREARRKIFANLLPAGTPPTDDVATWWTQLAQAAAANDAVSAAWTAEGNDISLDGAPLPAKYTPKGFVYSLDFGPESDCLIESVGPDMTVQ